MAVEAFTLMTDCPGWMPQNCEWSDETGWEHCENYGVVSEENCPGPNFLAGPLELSGDKVLTASSPPVLEGQYLQWTLPTNNMGGALKYPKLGAVDISNSHSSFSTICVR